MRTIHLWQGVRVFGKCPVCRDEIAQMDVNAVKRNLVVHLKRVHGIEEDIDWVGP